jgi:putative transposase
MQITVKAKIQPTKEQKVLIDATTREYIKAANRIVSDYIAPEKT